MKLQEIKMMVYKKLREVSLYRKKVELMNYVEKGIAKSYVNGEESYFRIIEGKIAVSLHDELTQRINDKWSHIATKIQVRHDEFWNDITIRIDFK